MKHVIIGAGAAGIAAAKTIRTLRPQDEIVMISEDEVIHSRCMLHKYISGERDEAGLCFVPEDFLTEYNIEWHRGFKVTCIETSTKTIFCGQDKRSYDKLLIAAGAVSTRVPVGPLRTAANVYGLRNLSDAKIIRDAAQNAQRVVVIGAGLVGLDAAYALLELKKEVTVIDMEDRIMSINLDQRSAAAYQNRFESAGCVFRLGCKVVNAETGDGGNVTTVILDDGSELPCDFVVAAAGVRPATEFLKDSGITIETGITVDKHMATNTPDVYAAGDITGLSAIWPNAVRQGEVAAKNMCGGSEIYDDFFTAKNTVNFYGLATMTLGLLEPEAGDQVEIREDRNSYRKTIMREGCVVGLIIQGNFSNSGFWQQLIKHGIQIDNIKKPIYKISFADFYALDETGKYIYSVNE